MTVEVVVVVLVSAAVGAAGVEAVGSTEEVVVALAVEMAAGGARIRPMPM